MYIAHVKANKRNQLESDNLKKLSSQVSAKCAEMEQIIRQDTCQCLYR